MGKEQRKWLAVQNLKRVFGHISPAFAIGITHGRYGGIS